MPAWLQGVCSGQSSSDSDSLSTDPRENPNSEELSLTPEGSKKDQDAVTNLQEAHHTPSPLPSLNLEKEGEK